MLMAEIANEYKLNSDSGIGESTVWRRLVMVGKLTHDNLDAPKALF